jgi:hypothetical protein
MAAALTIITQHERTEPTMQTISNELLSNVTGARNATQKAHASAVDAKIHKEWDSSGVVKIHNGSVNSNGDVKGTFTVDPLWGGDPFQRSFQGHANKNGAHFSSKPR